MPHPAALIFLWLCLTVLVQPLHGVALLGAAIPLAAIALNVSFARFRTLLRRTRWIMFSLLLIYGYATPGAALWTQWGMFSPTQAGLLDGLLQLLRLACALAGLSIVLALLSRQQLIAGLYTLAYPLRYLGLSRERFAVRLALTLHYAESAMLETAADWRGNIDSMLAPTPMSAEQRSIALATEPFTLRDSAWLLAGCVTLAWVLL